MSRMRTCPSCSVTLARHDWSKLWWMSWSFTGRLVQPCRECGALIRFSALTLLTGVGAIGLMLTAALFVKFQSVWLLVLALVSAVVILVGVLGTRLETVTLAPSAAAKVPEL